MTSQIVALRTTQFFLAPCLIESLHSLACEHFDFFALSHDFSLMDMGHVFFLEILPNRVRRNYSGGALLESWTAEGQGQDGVQPEDWIGSTIEAVNPGLSYRANEGLTPVRAPGGEVCLLADILKTNPEYYLGSPHIEKHGIHLGFLAKLLDSAIRLHVQAHPTADFAQAHLNSRYGKLETYVVLALREGMSPYLRLGFQQAPDRTEWRRIITEQDIPAMDACFEPIPIHVGEVWRVPGGLPHAIGEGALVLEVMEPSDWVVRCEFEREGIVVPPQGRFMQRGLDFCLDIFDYEERPVEAIRELCCLQARRISSNEALTHDQLVGSEHTRCFEVQRLVIQDAAFIPDSGRIALCLVTQGTGMLQCGNQSLQLRPGSRFFLPAQGPAAEVVPDKLKTIEILLCLPT